MIRALIIDDEKKNRDLISGLLSQYFPNIDIVGQAEGVKSGLGAINQHRPDLVLLDIKMEDGNAFDLLQQIPEINFKIIFITAYEEYALKAIKFSALDYLLKPVSVEDLRQAFVRAENQILAELKQQLATLHSNLQSPKDKTLVLRTSEKIFLVGVKDIIRCEADRNYTCFHVNGQRKYLVSQPMGDYEELLEEYGFLRIHKSHMVNIAFIDNFDRTEGGAIILKDRTELPVARRKKIELIERISRL